MCPRLNLFRYKFQAKPKVVWKVLPRTNHDWRQLRAFEPEACSQFVAIVEEVAGQSCARDQRDASKEVRAIDHAEEGQR